MHTQILDLFDLILPFVLKQVIYFLYQKNKLFFPFNSLFYVSHMFNLRCFLALFFNLCNCLNWLLKSQKLFFKLNESFCTCLALLKELNIETKKMFISIEKHCFLLSLPVQYKNTRVSLTKKEILLLLFR